MLERAILYGRVSTDEQAEQGNGLSYQRGRGKGYATMCDDDVEQGEC